jgi:hypothetical protein
MARIHMTISDEVLEAIDRVAGKRGRSRFIEEAAAEKLECSALRAAMDESAGIARGSAYAHWRDRATAAAWVRKTRRTGAADERQRHFVAVDAAAAALRDAPRVDRERFRADIDGAIDQQPAPDG